MLLNTQTNNKYEILYFTLLIILFCFDFSHKMMRNVIKNIFEQQ